MPEFYITEPGGTRRGPLTENEVMAAYPNELGMLAILALYPEVQVCLTENEVAQVHAIEAEAHRASGQQ